MTHENHSIKIKVKAFEATAQGWGGLATLLILAALVGAGVAVGWWSLPIAFTR